MSVLIRMYTPDDRGALIEQFLNLNRYEELLAQDRRIDTQGAVECVDDALQRVRRTSGAVLVAEYGGGIVAHLVLVFEQDGIYVRDELRTYGLVSELFVRTEARELGVATALLAEAERLTIRRGLVRLKIGVLAGNTPAAALYSRFGFTPYATELEKRLA